jgi:hypothetical protein
MVSYVKGMPRNDMVIKLLHSEDLKRECFYGFSHASSSRHYSCKIRERDRGKNLSNLSLSSDSYM